MVGVDGDFNVPEDPAAELRQVFENLAGVLDAMGTSLEHVIETTEFVAGDIEALFPGVRRGPQGGVRGTPFCQHMCLRQTIARRALPRGSQTGRSGPRDITPADLPHCSASAVENCGQPGD